jgi:hypothetical protein
MADFLKKADCNFGTVINTCILKGAFYYELLIEAQRSPTAFIIMPLHNNETQNHVKQINKYSFSAFKCPVLYTY